MKTFELTFLADTLTELDGYLLKTESNPFFDVKSASDIRRVHYPCDEGVLFRYELIYTVSSALKETEIRKNVSLINPHKMEFLKPKK